MANLNKVFLMGNLTRDPELRYSGGGAGGGPGGGSAICKFGLACNRQWRDQAGQTQEEVTFVDITVFARQAETCNEYLRKGRPVFIEGRLEFSQWEDRETHQKRSKLAVVAERVQFLGSRDGADGAGVPRGAREESSGGSGGGSGGSGGGSSSGNDGPPAGAPGGAASRGGRPSAPPAEGVDFDDIPF